MKDEDILNKIYEQAPPKPKPESEEDKRTRERNYFVLINSNGTLEDINREAIIKACETFNKGFVNPDTMLAKVIQAIINFYEQGEGSDGSEL